jgi:hypothetical protein
MVLFWCVLGRATVDRRCRPVCVFLLFCPSQSHRYGAGWMTGRWRTLLLSGLPVKGERGECIDHTTQLHLRDLQMLVM